VDFIAMGTHGRSGIGQALMGSIATSVVRQSPVPVLLVSEHAGVRAVKEMLAGERL
jgi:nucleotide-binding universal stress UspA family protein